MQDTTPPERVSSGPDNSAPPALAIGGVLILVGAALLAGQLLDVNFSDIGWPIWIIGGGLLLLVLGLVVVNESGMVVGGTVVTTVGLVLLYQERTDHWESWAYAWALVGPAASGLGLALWGIRKGSGTDIRNGTWGLVGGLAFFAVGFLFFEGVIGISGRPFDFPEWLLPAAVIAIGVVVLARGVLQRPAPEDPAL
jgi:hypothetical protein